MKYISLDTKLTDFPEKVLRWQQLIGHLGINNCLDLVLARYKSFQYCNIFRWEFC